MTTPPPGSSNSRELPRELYRFFLRTAGAGELPSLHKFAVSAGLTLEEIAAFRSHRQFDRAVRACSEIRRDWLIDGGLSKRLDSSLVRFLLSAEFGMGERAEEEDDRLSVTMTVVK